MEKENYFITRHGKMTQEDKEESEILGLAVEGEKQIRGNTQELIEMINRSEKDAVIFFGAASEHIRTDATLLAYGGELQKQYKDNQEIVVYIPEVVKKWQKVKKESGGMSTALTNQGMGVGTIKEILDATNEISNTIQENPDKKIVVVFPLYLKDFSFWQRGWINKETFDFVDYVKEIQKEYQGEDEQEKYAHFIKRWFETNGQLGDLRGPNPEECAEAVLRGIRRYEKFASTFTKDRPLIIGMSGHAWELEACIVKLATGELTPAAFDRVMGSKSMDTSEAAQIKITEDRTEIIFRGCAFEIDREKYHA